VWFRRRRLFIVSPDSRGTACPLSGRNSTYRPVQILEAGSQVENVDGNMMVVNGNVYNGCIINNVGADAAKLEVPVRKGAKQLELVRGRKKIGTYTPDDVAQFRSIKPTERPIESEIEAIVEVVAPVLQGEGMWRFKYGRMPLTAKVLDEEFRHRVSNKRGELPSRRSPQGAAKNSSGERPRR
jgi:hypothetical protein